MVFTSTLLSHWSFSFSRYSIRFAIFEYSSLEDRTLATVLANPHILEEKNARISALTGNVHEVEVDANMRLAKVHMIHQQDLTMIVQLERELKKLKRRAKSQDPATMIETHESNDLVKILSERVSQMVNEYEKGKLDIAEYKRENGVLQSDKETLLQRMDDLQADLAQQSITVQHLTHMLRNRYDLEIWRQNVARVVQGLQGTIDELFLQNAETMAERNRLHDEIEAWRQNMSGTVHALRGDIIDRDCRIKTLDAQAKTHKESIESLQAVLIAAAEAATEARNDFVAVSEENTALKAWKKRME